MCQRKHYEEGVGGDSDIWYPWCLADHWQVHQFLKSISMQGLPSHPFLTGSVETDLHTDKVRVGLLRKGRLFPKHHRAAGMQEWHAQSFSQLDTRLERHGRGGLNGSEQMGSRWELFQRQTEMCFKKHRVINKPNYSKFRRMADDTGKRQRGAEVHASLSALSTWSPSIWCAVAARCNTTPFCGSRPSGWTECRRLSLQALVRSGAHTVSSKSKMPSWLSL